MPIRHQLVRVRVKARARVGVGVRVRFRVGVRVRIRVSSSLPGTCFARLNWPPMASAASKSVTSCPRRAAVVEHARPAGPAPTTASRRGVPLMGA